MVILDGGTSRQDRSLGFTLIEMMSVVAAIAILAAIALPAYSDYVKRGKLPDAFNQMTGLSMALEQYYQDNRQYTNAAGQCGVAAPASTANFQFACTSTAASNYTITATGLTGTTVSGFVFTLNQAGVRATTGAPSGWPTSTSCWISSKSGTCS